MEFIARQPIFDAHCNVVAYELLFRSSSENLCAESDLDLASFKAMSTAMLIGLDVLSGGHKIYLNCTEQLLCGKYPTLFPPQLTVVEVLENVAPNPPVISACRELKSAGYAIALDDFDGRSDPAELVELADVIKVDFRLTSISERAALLRRYGRNGRVLLAEKVETYEEFTTAWRQGYNLFQGYFFCRPKILSTKSVSSLNPQHIRLLRMLASPKLDFHEVEALIRTDPALCLRLLRYLNSPIFGFQKEIQSILQALTLLGETELRKWLFLMSAIVVGKEKSELVKLALIRARFAELLGPDTGLCESQLFLLGLLSLMDAMLEIPLLSLVDKLALPAELRASLLGTPSPLRDCLELVLAYEMTDWPVCDRLCEKYRMPLSSMPDKYLEALRWAESVLSH